MPRIFLLVLAFALPWAWNAWNLQEIRESGEGERLLRMDRTVATADDASYLAPMDDLLGALGIGPATGRPVKAEFRTPGYGLWYLALRTVLSEQQALGALRVIHTLLFALATLLFWQVMITNGMPAPLRWTTALVFIVAPLFHGFHFYTLTEAVTPALAVMVLCCAMLYTCEGDRKQLIAGLALWALLILTRPVLLWAGVPLLMAVLIRNTGRTPWPRLALLSVLVVLPTLLWWAVNMHRNGGWLSLHPVYRPDAGSVYRPTHKAIWELGKSWGLRGDRFHSIMEPAFRAALDCDTTDRFALEFIQSAPHGQLSITELHDIRSAFRSWQRFTCVIHSRIREGHQVFAHGPIAEEQRIVVEIDRITDRYRSAHWFHYAVVAPLGVVRLMIAHSNLNLYLFQHTYRGKWWMELLRWISLLIHLGLFLVVLATALMPTGTVLRSAALLALLYIAYLAWGQRGIEERYTLPVVHLAMVMAPFVIRRVLLMWRNRSTT